MKGTKRGRSFSRARVDKKPRRTTTVPVPKYESKFFDTTDSITVPVAGDVNASLCLVQAGTGDSNRVGRKITATKLNIRGKLEMGNQTDSNSACAAVRVIIFIDKQCNGAAAGAGDILASTDWRSYRNLDNATRFQVLKDVLFDINSHGSNFDGAAVDTLCWEQSFSWSIPLKNLPIYYDASTGAVTDLTSNNIGVLAIASRANTGLDYIARLRFADF